MRIALTGGHGVGKSSLAKHFPNRLEEVARKAISEPEWGNPSTYDQDKFDRFELEILKRQIEQEKLSGDFISDRSVLDVLAYSTLLASPKATKQIKDIVEEYLKTNPYDIVFYIPIEFPMEKDGVRFEDEYLQHLVDAQIVKYLERYKIKCIKLTGSVEERLSTMRQYLPESSQ